MLPPSVSSPPGKDADGRAAETSARGLCVQRARAGMEQRRCRGVGVSMSKLHAEPAMRVLDRLALAGLCCWLLRCSDTFCARRAAIRCACVLLPNFPPQRVLPPDERNRVTASAWQSEAAVPAFSCFSAGGLPPLS